MDCHEPNIPFLLRSDAPQKIHGQRINVRIRKVRIGNQKPIVNRAKKIIDHDVEIDSIAEFARSKHPGGAPLSSLPAEALSIGARMPPLDRGHIALGSIVRAGTGLAGSSRHAQKGAWKSA